MELKQGYKQTEIGVIPKDWDVKSIEQLFHFYSTSNYSKAQMTLEGEVGCLHYGLIHAIKYSSFNVKSGIKYYVAKYQAKYELVLDGDIVMVDASEDLSGVNKSVEIEGVGNKPYIAGLHTFLLRDRGYFTDYFRGAILNSNIVKPQMLRLAVGMKVYGVSKHQLKTVLIPIPPLPEQSAIANALSDMDALINQTEKLIEKKKAIKQGVMHELLKPKEGWVTKKLGEVCEIYQPQTISADKFTNDGYLVFGANGVIGYYNHYNHKEWQVTITCRGSTCGTVNKSVNFSWITGNAMVMNVDDNKKIDKVFFYYLLLNQDFSQTITGSGQPQIVRAPLDDFGIKMPNQIDEQKIIAETLKDIDSSIEKLETKLQKLKLLKRGMLQSLLTGKIKLV